MDQIPLPFKTIQWLSLLAPLTILPCNLNEPNMGVYTNSSISQLFSLLLGIRSNLIYFQIELWRPPILTPARPFLIFFTALNHHQKLSYLCTGLYLSMFPQLECKPIRRTFSFHLLLHPQSKEPSGCLLNIY